MTSSFLLEPMLIGNVIPTNIVVLLGAVFIGVLISDLIGNMIAFDTPFVNAIVTTIVATLIVFGISYALGITNEGNVDEPQTFLAVAVLVFISDLIGNFITFGEGRRFANALTTAIIATVLVAVGIYLIDPTLYRI